ncbi:MAG: hypothetical protein WCC87_15660 [Candidatus Korobacteraceae bacterium]
MKRTVYSILSLLVIAMVVGVSGAHAQTQVANIPFDFSLGHKMMGAGSYELQSISQQAEVVRNVDTNAAAIFIKSKYASALEPGHARLVFDKYGDQYFLRQVWDGNSNIGIQLPLSKREKEVSLADNKFSDGPEMVTIAMK